MAHVKFLMKELDQDNMDSGSEADWDEMDIYGLVRITHTYVDFNLPCLPSQLKLKSIACHSISLTHWPLGNFN